MSYLEAYCCYAEGEAGLDEAGRGCLAGPVMAAAVILPADADHPLLNDSKKLNESQRMILRGWVKANAVAWAIGEASAEEIDRINILNASFLAMHRALDKLGTEPRLLLVDGNRFKAYRQLPHHCVVGGDGRYRSIAAASILAKTERDLFMQSLHPDFEAYHWDRNKGYPTKKHKKAIATHGYTCWHRKTFNAAIQHELDL